MILSSYLWVRKKQSGNKEFFVIMMKCIYEKTSTNIIFDGQILRAVHLFLLSFFLLTSFIYFLYKFIYFNWRLITLQYCSDFAIHWHRSAMGVHVFPILNTPPHPISLGDPSALAPSTQSHASNLDWQSFSHMITYMFQCHSPKSSHPGPLPQSP